jgi:2-oxoglutarate dehydrogenase E2 component (dihydrolipoamide succinyltransferase)
MDVKIPAVGESVQEAVLAEWFKQDGDVVEKDEPLFVLETDKVTLEVTAEIAGTLSIAVAAGETVAIGDVVARIEPGAKKEPAASAQAPEADRGAPEKETTAQPTEEPAAAAKPEPEKSKAQPEAAAAKPRKAGPAPEPEAASKASARQASNGPFPPSLRRLLTEKQLDPGTIKGTGPGGRTTKADVLLALAHAADGVRDERAAAAQPDKEAAPEQVRKAMSPIRKRIAARLLEATQNTAMLTTFNDIDMSRAMALAQRTQGCVQGET